MVLAVDGEVLPSQPTLGGLSGRPSFAYDTIRFQRTHTPARWSLFDWTYWFTTLPRVPLSMPWARIP